METEFTDAVASWRDFHTTMAGVAATLVGLLFVALAFNPSVMHDERPAGTRVWGLQTFNIFLAVLGLALIVMVPDIGHTALGTALGVVGAQGIALVFRDFLMTRKDPDPFWSSRATIFRFGPPAGAYLILLWSAVLAFQADEAAMNWLFYAMFFLLLSAASNCWDLLKAIGKAANDD